jgi:hypothetical protein
LVHKWDLKKSFYLLYLVGASTGSSTCSYHLAEDVFSEVFNPETMHVSESTLAIGCAAPLLSKVQCIYKSLTTVPKIYMQTIQKRM